LVGSFNPGAIAAPVNVDFDVALFQLGDLLGSAGSSTELLGRDNDNNGLNEDDQLGMLSAILAGGASVSCIDAGRVLEIQNGFAANLPKVQAELVVNISGTGTFDIIAQLAASNPQLSAALKNAIAGYMTIADSSTFAFVNLLADQVIASYLKNTPQEDQTASVQQQINFVQSDYISFGNAPTAPNYLGPAGDIEEDGQSNLSEYTVGAVPKGREAWLTDCCITPPLRFVNISGGGLRVSGLTEVFSVTMAGGTGNLTYTWRKGNTVVASTASYTIDFLTTASSGTYYCEVSDGVTTRTTQNLNLSVTFVPMYFAQQPQGASKQLGRSHTFAVQVRGGVGPGPYKYTWKKGAQTVGTNQPTYTIPSITVADTGTYTVQVTSNNGPDTITSSNAVLNVASGPFVITEHPQSVKLYVGDPVLLTVAASGGSGNFSYTWLRNGETLVVTDTGQLGTSSVQLSDAATYRCIVTDLETPANQVTSEPAVVEVAQPVSITQQPDGAMLNVGESFVLAVAATGGFAPLTYQWRWEGINIPGQTAAVYSATAFAGFSGVYTCVITDASGRSITSNGATLLVDLVAEIIQQPLGGDFYLGQSHTLNIVVAGSGGFVYEWRRDGEPLGAPSLPSLTLSNLSIESAGGYSCVVSSETLAPVESAIAVVRVAEALSIAEHPEAKTLYLGESHTLSVGPAGGFPPYRYQWRKNNELLAGKTSQTLAIPSAGAGDQGTYTCVVSDQKNTLLVSSGALIFVVANLAVTNQPDSANKYVGDSLELLTEVFGGVPPLNYAWLRNDVILPGKTLPTLSFPSLAVANAGSYVCRVTDARGDIINSLPAVINVEPLLSVVAQPEGGVFYVGETRSLSFVVSGGYAPRNYLWRKGGTPILGATGATLVFSPVSGGTAGSYTCTVGDGLGRVITSQPAVVDVPQALSIEIEQPDTRSYVGESKSFSVVVDGGEEPFNFQWRKNGVLLAEATTAVLQLGPLALEDEALYSCLVTDASGGGLSNAVLLEVREELQVVEGPADDIAAAGGPGQFGVTVAGGYAPYTFQWQFEEEDIADELEDSLLIAAVSVANAGAYRCVVRDSHTAEVASPSAQLEVVDAMQFDEQPQSVSLYEGEAITLSASVTGGVQPLRWAWFKDDVQIEEADAPTYAVAEATLEDSGTYHVEVRDADDNLIQSGPISVTVVKKPFFIAEPQDLNLYVGAALVLSVEAGGGLAPLSYAWQRDGEPVGGNAPVLNLGSADENKAGLYTCTVTDGTAQATSEPGALVQVGIPIALDFTPRVITRPVGVSENFAITASNGIPPLTFAWFRGDELVAQSSLFSIASLTAEDAGDYRCVVSDAVTSVQSGTVVALTILSNEGESEFRHSADQDDSESIDLSELLRVVQFYNLGEYHCDDTTEDGYAPGPGDTSICLPHSSDYVEQDWRINLSELLRLIQIFQVGAFYACPGDSSEDGFCLGAPPDEK